MLDVFKVTICQQIFTCSKSSIEIVKKIPNMIKVNIKDTRTMFGVVLLFLFEI